MQGLGLYEYGDSQTWVFAYFKNNNIGKEFEKGVMGLKKSLPNFGLLEKKYQGQIEKFEIDQDEEYIDS